MDLQDKIEVHKVNKTIATISKSFIVIAVITGSSLYLKEINLLYFYLFCIACFTYITSGIYTIYLESKIEKELLDLYLSGKDLE